MFNFKKRLNKKDKMFIMEQLDLIGEAFLQIAKIENGEAIEIFLIAKESIQWLLAERR
jgi:hypothetical protein